MRSIRKSTFTLAVVVVLALTAVGGTFVFASNVGIQGAQLAVTLPTVVVSQDTFVRQGTVAGNTNFGGEVFLGVDGGTGEIEHTFLLFNVSGIPAGATIDSATLTVWTRPPTSVTGSADTSTNGSAEIFQVRTSDIGWSEAVPTYNNPLSCGAQVTTFGPMPSTQTAYTANVTSAISGNGEVGFCITLVNEGSTDGIKLESKEGTGGRAATLTINYTEAGVPTEVPTEVPTTVPGETPVPTVAPAATAIPRPGADMIPIPNWATGGKVVQWTHVYYQPVQGAAGVEELAPGTSIWVYGLDSTRQFYLGMLAGKLFWLPIADVGPNYESPWFGHPLPTQIVDGEGNAL